MFLPIVLQFSGDGFQLIAHKVADLHALAQMGAVIARGNIQHIAQTGDGGTQTEKSISGGERGGAGGRKCMHAKCHDNSPVMLLMGPDGGGSCLHGHAPLLACCEQVSRQYAHGRRCEMLLPDIISHVRDIRKLYVCVAHPPVPKSAGMNKYNGDCGGEYWPRN